jgi:hypothetical protein
VSNISVANFRTFLVTYPTQSCKMVRAWILVTAGALLASVNGSV